ncbi:MAG: cytochrome c [Rubrivivax sp.]|nr:cytochrome c [Rubrivivax sp.]
MLAVLLAIGAGLGGCERVARDMYSQPRYDPGEASPLFADGKASRAPPAGSVPRAMGDLAATSSGRVGAEAVTARVAAEQAASAPVPTLALLQRGRSRYEIDCLPCHSPLGDGDGPVVRRGFPRPPSYHQARLRDATDRHLFDVISHGYGVMPSYGDRLAPADRWAVVAYVRALQLSQHAPVEALPPALQATLRAQATPAPSAAAGPAPAASKGR